MGFGSRGLGLELWMLNLGHFAGLGQEVEDLRLSDLEFRIQGVRLRVEDTWLRVGYPGYKGGSQQTNER